MCFEMQDGEKLFLMDIDDTIRKKIWVRIERTHLAGVSGQV